MGGGAPSRAAGIALLRPSLTARPNYVGAFYPPDASEPDPQRRMCRIYYDYFIAGAPPSRPIDRLSSHRLVGLPTIYGLPPTMYAPFIPDMVIAQTDNRRIHPAKPYRPHITGGALGAQKALF